MRDAVTILTYHRVLPDAEAASYPAPTLAMPVSEFRAQVAELSQRFEVTTLDAALTQLGRTPTQRPIVCLTFDDGYLDNYENAAPILEAHGVRGTFFVTAGLIGTPRLLWYDRATLAFEARAAGAGGRPTPRQSLFEWLETLKRQSVAAREDALERVGAPAREAPHSRRFALMSTEQVRELHRRGHEIGSHSLEHPILPALDDAALAAEVGASRRLIAELLDVDVAGFCYPNGDCDARVIAAVEAAGYRYACTTRSGRNLPTQPRFELVRRDVTPSRIAAASAAGRVRAFRAEISGFRDALLRRRS
ncbi:MAG: polysaccharide deacetylase family protein [Planctomycetota bacterium]